MRVMNSVEADVIVVKLNTPAPSAEAHAKFVSDIQAQTNQVLPDGLGVAAFREFHLDGFPVDLADAGRGTAIRW